MTTQTLPSADDLTYRQHQGWACVWCEASLWTTHGGVSAGRAYGADGSSIEVYQCPGAGCLTTDSRSRPVERRPGR